MGDNSPSKNAVIITPQGVDSLLLTILEDYTWFKVAHAPPVRPKKQNEAQAWKSLLDENHILVFQDKNFYEVLKYGYLRMHDFDMAVFTHCQHATTNQVENIMTDFYRFDIEVAGQRPKTFILGLADPEYLTDRT